MVVLRVTAILATVLLQLAWAEHMFDYVIVGGGTCGLLLAKRLSEDSNNQVAVIEPGGDVRNNPAVTVISSWTENQDSPIDWDYKSVAQQHADNRVLTYHAGKAIGGTSTMNGKYCPRELAPAGAMELGLRLTRRDHNRNDLYPRGQGRVRGLGTTGQPRFHLGQHVRAHEGHRELQASG